MAFNYNNEIVDLLLKKNLGSAYTTSGLVSGQETQILEKFHNLQVFFDTITDKNESAFTWSSATNVTGGGTVKTLSNVAGESNPGYYTHIKKYENIPMTSVPGTEYRAWRPTNDDMKTKFKDVILGRSNFDFIISSNITSYGTIYNTSSAFKPLINNGVLIFLGNVKPAGNNTITMKEVYIVEGYSGTFANIQLNDIADISSSNPLNTQPLIFDGATQKWTEGSIKYDHFPIQGLGDLDDVDTTTVAPNYGIFWNGFDWSSDILVHLLNHFSNIDTNEMANIPAYNDTKFPLSLVYNDLSGNFRARRLQYPTTTINDISNVDMTTVVPQNDQILTWDDGFQVWVADNVSAPITHLNDISGINVDNIKFDEGIVLDPSGGNKFITKAIPRRIDSINDLRDVNISGLNVQIPQWSQKLKMQASDEDINDNFGSTVVMNDDYILIGSYNAQGVSLSDVGKVYVWKKSYSTFSEYQILAPNLQAAVMNFGSSVAIKDNFLMVGAPNRFFNSKEKAGSVYYYKYNGGTAKWGILNNGPYKEDELIEHSSPAAFDRFGCSISIDGNYMIIGASGKGGGGKGKACVYKYQSNNWVFVKDIVGSTSVNNDEFGHKVQVLGNLAYVSAPNHNTNRGIIYIFNRTNGGSDNWGEIQKVVMESAYINTYFGNDFSFGSSWGIIGSKRSDTLKGEAYFIYYNTSTERWGTQGISDYQPNQTVVASDGSANDLFGYAVSLYGNDVIIGAYKKKGDGTNETGGAYIYKYTGENFWELHKQINANDMAQDDEYGISVFMHNRYAIVGSWKEESTNTDLNAGAAYLFNIPQPLNGGTRCVIYDTDVNRYVVGMITSAGVGVLIREIKQLRDISGADWTNTTDISKNSVMIYDDTLLPVKLRYEVVKPGTKIKISDISDVDLSGVETGKCLTYDASLNKWIPGDAGGNAAGVGVFNTPPETDPPTIGQMYFDSSDNKFYGRLIDTWEEVLTHGTGYFFGHSSDTISHFNNTFSMKTEDWTTSNIKIREFAATIQFLNTDGFFWDHNTFQGDYRVVVSGALTTLYNSTYGTTGAQLPGSYDYTSTTAGRYFYATWKPPSQAVLDNICNLVNTRMFSINWRNPIQRKSPIAPKNASDKVDGDYYLPVIHDMYIEIVPESSDYTGTGIKIGGRNISTTLVDGNTTQKVTVPPTTPNELGGPYSSPATILTSGVRIYKTGESPDGFTGTKDNIQKPGGYGENQIYRINPSTLTLASGTTYKARVWSTNLTSTIYSSYDTAAKITQLAEDLKPINDNRGVGGNAPTTTDCRIHVQGTLTQLYNKTYGTTSNRLPGTYDYSYSAGYPPGGSYFYANWKIPPLYVVERLYKLLGKGHKYREIKGITL